MIWTLRSLQGPLIESLIVLERYLYLEENLKSGWKVQLIPLLGSLRCYALCVNRV